MSPLEPFQKTHSPSWTTMSSFFVRLSQPSPNQVDAHAPAAPAPSAQGEVRARDFWGWNNKKHDDFMGFGIDLW